MPHQSDPENRITRFYGRLNAFCRARGYRTAYAIEAKQGRILCVRRTLQRSGAEPLDTAFDFWDSETGLPLTIRDAFGDRARARILTAAMRKAEALGGDRAGFLTDRMRRLEKAFQEGAVGYTRDGTVLLCPSGTVLPEAYGPVLLSIDP